MAYESNGTPQKHRDRLYHESIINNKNNEVRVRKEVVEKELTDFFDCGVEVEAEAEEDCGMEVKTQQTEESLSIEFV